MSRDKADRWRLARNCYASVAARLTFAAWVALALVILMENGWALEAVVGVVGGSLAFAALVFWVLTLDAASNVELPLTGRTPPPWTAQDEDVQQ